MMEVVAQGAFGAAQIVWRPELSAGWAATRGWEWEPLARGRVEPLVAPCAAGRWLAASALCCETPATPGRRPPPERAYASDLGAAAPAGAKPRGRRVGAPPF